MCIVHITNVPDIYILEANIPFNIELISDRHILCRCVYSKWDPILYFSPPLSLLTPFIHVLTLFCFDVHACDWHTNCTLSSKYALG